MPQTGEGRILGTVAYMSPEQARGQAVDKRTDVWAFGCVLYEALAGRRAFKGGTVSDTFAAVLEREVDWETLPAGTPAALRSLLRRCLQKDRERRLRDIGDARIEIEEAGAEQSRPASAGAAPQGSLELSRPTPAGPWRWRREHLAWLGMAALALSTLVLATVHFQKEPPATPPVRLSVLPPPDTSFSLVQLALSPNGESLAFVAVHEGGRRLLGLRALDTLEPRVLAGTDGALASPFWSPDSRFIGFFSEGKLKKVRASGGPAETIVDALPRAAASWAEHYNGGGSWNRDGVIIFGSEEGVLRVDAGGGAPAPVTRLDAALQELEHVHPQFLPDGRRFLFLARTRNDERSGIHVGSLDSTDTKRVLSTRLNAVYAPPGYLLFAHEGSVSAAPFDADALEVTGDPVLLVEDVRCNLSRGRVGFSASDNGVLAFHGGSAGTPFRLVWVDRDGNELGSVEPTSHHHRLRFSPDEGRLALVQVNHQTGESDIWLTELSRDLTSRFTFSGALDPVWSPDGGRIAYSRRNPETYAIVQKSVGSGDTEDVLFESSDPLRVDDWARDGRTLLYESGGDIYWLPLADGREATPLLSTPYTESDARFSPDGHRVAYCSNETGRTEVYVRSMTTGHKQRISSEGGRRPRWRTDGKELFYVGANNMLVAVGLDTDSSPAKVAAPRELFRSGLRLSCGDYTPARAGDKFLIGRPVEDLPASPITVVLNWRAGLDP